MKTIKLELSVKLLLGAIALGLFLNVFNDFPPKANAEVDGMGWYELANDRDFKSAVKNIVEMDCRVKDSRGKLDC